MRRTAVQGAAAVAWLLAAAGTGAQAPPGPLPPRPGTAIQQPPPPIRVKVDLVTTPVTVRAPEGGMVLDLEARDFRIFDNGVEQKIEHFDLGGAPLSVALVFETSSRVEPLLPALRRTGIIFTQSVLGPAGHAAVLAFDDTPQVLLPFSNNHEEIEQAVTRLRLGTRGALLYDTMRRAVSLLDEQPRPRRRVMIVVAEAVDTGSDAKLGEVIREAQLANVTIYSVGLSTTAAELRQQPEARRPISPTPEGTFGRPPIPGSVQTPTTEQQRSGYIDYGALLKYIVEHLQNAVGHNELELAARGTGGMLISTFRERSIESAVSEIGGELHAQYALGYFPAGVSPTGHHEIEVRVNPRAKNHKLEVRSRPGYYLPPPETP